MSDFLKEATVLIVSNKASHRTSIKKLLIDQGVKNNKIDGISDFSQGKIKLSLTEVNILILDDEEGIDGSPLELLKSHQENNPKVYSRLTILTPGPDTDLLKEDFIKMGGDLIIEKPYTASSFLSLFCKMIESKYSFSEEELMALDVEYALNHNNREEAVEFFKTIKNSNSPSATFSQGMISLFDNNYQEAYNSFQKAVLKKFDLKTVEKLLLSGVKIKKYKELNPYVDQLVKELHLSSDFATDIARVVLYNKKFSLLDEMKIQENESTLPLAAGFLVAALASLDHGDVEKTIEYSFKAIEKSSNKSSIILKAIEILLQAGANDKAQELYVDMNVKYLPDIDREIINNLEKIFVFK